MLNDKKNNGFSLAPDNTKPSGSLIYRIIKRGFDVLFSASRDFNRDFFFCYQA